MDFIFSWSWLTIIRGLPKKKRSAFSNSAYLVDLLGGLLIRGWHEWCGTCVTKWHRVICWNACIWIRGYVCTLLLNVLRCGALLLRCCRDPLRLGFNNTWPVMWSDLRERNGTGLIILRPVPQQNYLGLSEGLGVLSPLRQYSLSSCIISMYGAVLVVNWLVPLIHMQMHNLISPPSN